METIQVQGAPNFYQCHQGVLHSLPEKIKKHGATKALILHGEKSWNAAKSFLPLWPISVTHLSHRKKCTHEETKRISAVISEEKIDLIIAVGGGTCCDLAKAAGHTTNTDVILIPTLASNCAAWTPLSVFYDQSGNFVEYKVFPKSTYMVLVEPAIILNSPKDYLRAGIGDTLAKWYEADVLIRPLSEKTIPIQIAHHAAKLCKEQLILDGAAALLAQENNQLSDAFIRVAETIILAGGMVGSYADQYGRIAAAHSIHNGLTKVTETASVLHGDKVAYGILVQLVLEKRFVEIIKLLPFYKSLSLPISLKELNIQEERLEEATQITATASTQADESIHLIGEINPSDVAKAMKELEQCVSQYSSI
ncbi:iron-containing alcohol dehydrogenase family protein [Alkalihalobacillus sp. 1P02AB]|uniref:iron-containing alcohol dehydrogenase family protein n=1 Tax=Alkalihalobacillus sp. 1P02AB TaxID=3132260 RepID=UPI0039A44DF8